MIKDMTIPDKLLIELLKESVEECYEKDSILIERSMEQASVARIFYYMQNRINADERFACLRVYNLDCEYNKNKQHIKATPRCKNGTRPDMILHERECNNHNLLIMEFKADKRLKKNLNSILNDISKLEDFTSPHGYNYQLGVLIKMLKVGPVYILFKKGKQI